MAKTPPKAFLLRLPPDVHDRVQRLAADQRRSLNGQIAWLLVEALEKGQAKRPPKKTTRRG